MVKMAPSDTLALRRALFLVLLVGLYLAFRSKSSSKSSTSSVVDPVVGTTDIDSLLDRVAVIEEHYFDTRGTCSLLNVHNNNMISSDGNLYPDDGNIRLQYRIMKRS